MLKKNNIMVNKKCLLILFILFFFIYINLIKKIKIIKKNSKLKKNCYLSPDNLELKIIHLIITRFKLGFSHLNDTTNEYTLNGIRVMKKYLLFSLENQSCKDFNWILLIGNKANITHIKSLLTFNNSFQWHIIYKKDFKKFLRNITKGFNILITTRMDYDDRIYYDAVNDVRKEINIDKPMFLYGYNRGVLFFELNNKYYEYVFNVRNGALAIFESLIVVLNKVNDTYTIYDLGNHVYVRKKLLNNYKSYGIKQLNYEPAIFESGDLKYVYVRQNYSLSYNRIKITKNLKAINFNLSKFYGK